MICYFHNGIILFTFSCTHSNNGTPKIEWIFYLISFRRQGLMFNGLLGIFTIIKIMLICNGNMLACDPFVLHHHILDYKTRFLISLTDICHRLPLGSLCKVTQIDRCLRVHLSQIHQRQ